MISCHDNFFEIVALQHHHLHLKIHTVQLQTGLHINASEIFKSLNELFKVQGFENSNENSFGVVSHFVLQIFFFIIRPTLSLHQSFYNYYTKQEYRVGRSQRSQSKLSHYSFKFINICI